MSTKTTPLKRFAEEHGATDDEVFTFNRVAWLRACSVEHELNGDSHPQSANSRDKNKNAKVWKKGAGHLADQMTRLAQGWGFDRLDFGVGLYPTLEKGDDTTMFPYDNYEADPEYVAYKALFFGPDDQDNKQDQSGMCGFDGHRLDEDDPPA